MNPWGLGAWVPPSHIDLYGLVKSMPQDPFKLYVNAGIGLAVPLESDGTAMRERCVLAQSAEMEKQSLPAAAQSQTMA